MATLLAALTIAAAALGLAACGQRHAGDAWLGEPKTVEVPAGPGSRYPGLAPSPDGRLVLSWLEPAGEEFSLRFAQWTGSGWSEARTVATGRDWFVNWADFPSVVPVRGPLWAAHWLQQVPGNAYSYEVRIAASTDEGRTWRGPTSPHDDGTATEHGFVSLFDDGGRIGAVWLDGRKTGGSHEHDGADGAMTIRGAVLDAGAQRVGPDVEIDGRTCDCCQTGAAVTARGPVVVYRDRGVDGTRDIYIVRREAGTWTRPAIVGPDGWKIDACPVNGPAVDARGELVVVAWFTAPDVPRVRVAWSRDSGRTFAAPIEVASGAVAGRVDVVLLDDDRAVVSWLAEGGGHATITAQPFDAGGPAGTAAVIATADVSRASGFPRMARAGDALMFAWTQASPEPRIRAVVATVR